MDTKLQAGYGVHFGQNFTRLVDDTPIEITDWRGGEVYGYVDLPKYGRTKVCTITTALTVDGRMYVSMSGIEQHSIRTAR